VIVEAAERSGSLITARLAAEQNREVFAVPGHPYEPRAAGTNRLIKEGAVITTGPDDILEALQPLLSGWDCSGAGTAPIAQAPADFTPEARVPVRSNAPESLDVTDEATQVVLNALSLSPIDIDDLCRLTGLEARQVSTALLSLDLSGRIERRGLRQVALRP
jgi:DNA processing protein